MAAEQHALTSWTPLPGMNGIELCAAARRSRHSRDPGHRGDVPPRWSRTAARSWPPGSTATAKADQLKGFLQAVGRFCPSLAWSSSAR